MALRPEESCRRTAIGRAYSCACHPGRQRLADNGFVMVRGGDSHKQVWEKFDAGPDWACKKLFQMAKRLKDKRRQADCDATFPRLDDEIVEMLALTRRFADELSRLPRRLPGNTGIRT
jgi:hypothetical protein